MAFIPARGFLGTIKDIVLRGFNIGPAPDYAMTVGESGIKDVMTARSRISILLNASSKARDTLTAQSSIGPN